MSLQSCLITETIQVDWGGMIALSTIACLKSKEKFEQRETINKALEKGSVITADAGIKTISEEN